MKVFLSLLAEKKIILLLDYLEIEWSIKSRKEFLLKLKSKISQISNQPESCVKSKKFANLYKCVVTKHTSFYYRIKADCIEIITLIDNRQDPEKIKKEIHKYLD